MRTKTILLFAGALLSAACRRPVSVPPAAQLRVVGELRLPGYPHRVAVVGEKAYVACGQAGLVVVDISDPSSPLMLGSVMDSLNEAWGVAGNETLAFVAYGNKELMAVDTRRTDSLKVLGVLEYPQPAYGWNLVLRDTLVYIAADAQFIEVNVSDPRYPALVFQYYYPRSCRDVVTAGNFGYVAIEQLGFAVWRLDTFPPVQISSLDSPGNARGVAVAGRYLLVADGRSGLCIADVSDPRRPVEVSRLVLDGYANSVAVVDTLAYVGCGSGGVAVVNIAHPEKPILVARSVTPYATGVALAGGMAAVCDRDRGLVMFRLETEE